MSDELVPIHVRGEGADLVIQDGHVLALGDPQAVERLLTGLGAQAPSTKAAPISGGLLGTLTQIASGLPAGETEGKYFKFSDETMKQLRDGTLTETASGFNHAGIRDATGKYTGNVEWKQVNPEQIMNAQMVVAMAALQMAIKEVQAAVERVEAKVDEVRRRIAAQQIGDVMGRHAYLTRQIDLMEQTGRITETDWAAVAALGPALESDLAGIRAYITRTVADAKADGDTDDRADAVRELTKLDVDLDLLTVTEQSVFLYQSIRLQHLKQTDPDALELALPHARKALAAQQASDYELIQSLRETGEVLTRVKVLEIHRLISRKSLEAGVESLNALTTQFASSRDLELMPIPASERPTLDEAVSEVKRRAELGGATVKRGLVGAADGARGRLRRSNEADSMVLDAGDTPNALSAGSDESPNEGDEIQVDPAESNPDASDSGEGRMASVRNRLRRKKDSDEAPPPAPL